MTQDNLHIIAFVYLLSEGDDKNKCLLTADSIILIRRGKKTIFKAEQITSLYFSSKLFLFPLVFGGTFGPFFFIAILNSSFHPIVSLIGFLASLLSFYFGITGKKSFVLETVNDKKEVFLPFISPNLKEFVRFVNEVVGGNSKEEVLTFYFKLTGSLRKELIETGKLTIPEKGEFLYLKHEKDNDPTTRYLPVNYTIPTIRIKFERDQHNKLKPKIFGFISKDNELISSHLN